MKDADGNEILPTKVKIDGLGDEEFEVSEDGLRAIGEKALASMKDSHDQAVNKGNELVKVKADLDEKKARIAELEASQTPPPAQFDDIQDDEYLTGKDVKKLVSVIRADVKKELQPTQGALQNLSASVIESQIALIRAKRPELTNEDIQKIVAIRQNYRTDMMKDLLIQQGYNIQSVTPEDMALYIYEGAQKNFQEEETTGIQKQGVRTGGMPKKDSDDEKLTALGFTGKEIGEIHQLCADTKITVKEWIEHHKPVAK